MTNMKKIKKIILISFASIVGIIGMLVAFVVVRHWPAFEDWIILARGKVAKEYSQIKDAERIETLAAYVRTSWPDDDMHSLPEAAILSHHNAELNHC